MLRKCDSLWVLEKSGDPAGKVRSPCYGQTVEVSHVGCSLPQQGMPFHRPPVLVLWYWEESHGASSGRLRRGQCYTFNLRRYGTLAFIISKLISTK